MSPEGDSSLLMFSMERLQKAIDRRRRSVKIGSIAAAAAIIGEVITIPLVFYVAHDSEVRFSCALSVWIISYLLCHACVLPFGFLGMRKLERAILDLPDAADCGAVGPLIDVIAFYDPIKYPLLWGSDYRSYQAAVLALTNLLPYLTGADSSVLSGPQRHHLTRMLKHAVNPKLKRRYNIPFALAIIKAIEEVGDSSAVPILIRLVKRTPSDDDQRRLRDAAETCLSRVQERHQERDQQNSLLRAGSSIPTDTLLRAVTESPTTDPMQLLRPGQKDQ